MIEVSASPIEQQLKGQLRIGMAVFAGMLVGKHVLPAELANDQMLDIVTALVAGGAASAWSWVRAKLNHSRLWGLAVDPSVPGVTVKV